MTAPPPEALLAIELVSGRIVCPHCGAIELRYDGERDEIGLCHPYADCPIASRPDSGEAIALAMYAQNELCEHMAAEYGIDPLPVNAWEPA